MPGSLENDRATDIDALAKQHLDCSWKPRCDELNSPVLSLLWLHLVQRIIPVVLTCAHQYCIHLFDANICNLSIMVLYKSFNSLYFLYLLQLVVVLCDANNNYLNSIWRQGKPFNHHSKYLLGR